jgi:hypothetical protein
MEHHPLSCVQDGMAHQGKLRQSIEGPDLKDPLIILTAACMALRSYQHGNASPVLAKDTADAIEQFLLDDGFDKAATEVHSMIEAAGGKVDPGSTMQLPDGSGCFTASFPLPRDHWLYEPTGEPPAPWRIGDSIRRGELADEIKMGARYAVKASTMSGLDDDYDPDALVQNMIVGLLGYWTHDGHTHADDILNTSPDEPMVPDEGHEQRPGTGQDAGRTG